METEVLEKEIEETVEKPAWMLTWERKSKMTVEEQIREIVANWAENGEAINAKAKAIDAYLATCEKLVANEDELTEMVSKDRRERYEASLRH